MSRAPSAQRPSRERRLAAAAVAATAGSLALALGGILSLSAGLVVIAAVSGGAVGWLLRGQPAEQRFHPMVAIAIGLGGVAVGQVLLWLVAMLEGGVLGPLDYLSQAYGILVPAQLVAAGTGAWLAAR